MDAITPKAKHDTLDTHSHVVRPAHHGVEEDALSRLRGEGPLFDKELGVVTALMKFAPGAVLPDHEHVKIEQTYVLEGKLVDKEGPAKDLTVGPGEFVWREAGSRHVACTPEGGLSLPCSRCRTNSTNRTAVSPTFPAPIGTACGRISSRTEASRTRSFGTKRSRTKTLAALIVPNCGVKRSAKGTGPCCETSSKLPRS